MMSCERFDSDLKVIQETGGSYDDVLVLFMVLSAYPLQPHDEPQQWQQFRYRNRMFF